MRSTAHLGLWLWAGVALLPAIFFVAQRIIDQDVFCICLIVRHCAQSSLNIANGVVVFVAGFRKSLQKHTTVQDCPDMHLLHACRMEAHTAADTQSPLPVACLCHRIVEDAFQGGRVTQVCPQLGILLRLLLGRNHLLRGFRGLRPPGHDRAAGEGGARRCAACDGTPPARALGPRGPAHPPLRWRELLPGHRRLTRWNSAMH